MNLILDVIALLSFLVGLVGVFTIFSGAFLATKEYLKNPKESFANLRSILTRHLILGLDFLVCKDVIDTLLLGSGAEFWRDLVGLVVVVSIRIVLTHFTIKELETLQVSKKNPRKK